MNISSKHQILKAKWLGEQMSHETINTITLQWCLSVCQRMKWGVGFKCFSFKMTGNINNAINICLYPLLPRQVIPSQLRLHLDIDYVISVLTLGP